MFFLMASHSTHIFFSGSPVTTKHWFNSLQHLYGNTMPLRLQAKRTASACITLLGVCFFANCSKIGSKTMIPICHRKVTMSKHIMKQKIGYLGYVHYQYNETRAGQSCGCSPNCTLSKKLIPSYIVLVVFSK